MRREMGQVFKDGFTNMEFRLEKEDVCYDINFIVQYMIFDTVFCEERNKTRSLDLSRVRRHFRKSQQTDRQTIFFQKDILNGYLLLKVSFLPFRHKKGFKKPLKQFCDRPTDRPTDRPKSGL